MKTTQDFREDYEAGSMLWVSGKWEDAVENEATSLGYRDRQLEEEFKA